MHHGDAGRHGVVRVLEMHLFSKHEQPPFVGRLEAREDLAEGALARPVFTTQCVTRGHGNVERYAGERLHAGKALADFLESNGGLGH